MNRRELTLRAIAAMTGVMAGTPVLRVLAGEAPASVTAHSALDTRGAQMVSVLAEMIIPRTDSPGAIDAGVPAFVEMMVSEWYTDIERKIFLDGLRQLELWCLLNHQKNFLQGDEAMRTAALSEAEKAASTYVSPFGGPMAAAMTKLVDEHTPFFSKLKELVVIGYFTSEAGATKELSYNPMPMRYEGDYDYATTGRQWSF
jgi:hypothetical protein